MSTYERCPDCGRKALRYRKRTKDYSCKQCPFEGAAEDIEARERAVAHARDVADEAGRLEDARENVLRYLGAYARSTMPEPPDGEYEFGCGTGLLAAVISAVGAFFLGGAVIGKLAASSEVIRGFGPVVMLISMGGTFLVLFAITAVVLTLVFASMHKNAAERSWAADEERWRRSHPDCARFLALGLSSAELPHPDNWQLVKTLSSKALAAPDMDAFGQHCEIQESFRLVERDVEARGGGYRETATNDGAPAGGRRVTGSESPKSR